MRINKIDESLIVRLKKNEKKTNKEIAKLLQCAKSTVSYYLKKHGLDEWKIKKDVSKNIAEYYKTHTVKQTAKKFKVCASTVKVHSNRKRIASTVSRKEQIKAAVITWRRKIKKRAVELLGGKCQNCGYSKCIRALQFHHINAIDKDFHISGKSISWHKMKMEIKKCLLVCANCHAEIEEEIHENGFSNTVYKIMGV